ncbi:glutaredoxin [Cryptococcus bacillisporus CA1873]|uniref:Glutaredoxin n=1 Tax=Cryptococcus bacillisporus CA1873 TaxID=1296111 RepID=A0ABR5BHP1_CRYGA|nr:glutaredoxin [Cryptococcus bacillisporus CA1873]|eukprot:KIR68380.1 glutaredoxin [Cryptococcus gattii CA1873]
MSFTAFQRLTTLSIHITRAPISTRYFATAQTAKIGSSISTPNMSSDVKYLVDKAIADNKVVVFSKTYCPYCKRAKSYLAEDTNDIEILELDERDDGPAIQAYLKELNGQGTVPHVYINKEFIGGSSDLLKLSHEQVKKKISAASSA